MKLKNSFKTVLKLFRNCFVSAKTKGPGHETFYLLYLIIVFARRNQRRGEAMTYA